MWQIESDILHSQRENETQPLILSSVKDEQARTAPNHCTLTLFPCENEHKNRKKIKNPVELSFKVKSKIEHEGAKEKHEHTQAVRKSFFFFHIVEKTKKIELWPSSAGFLRKNKIYPYRNCKLYLLPLSCCAR